MKTIFRADGVHRQDDVELALERNKTLQNAPQAPDGFHHVASIPAIVIEKWMAEEGVPILSMPEHEFRSFIRRKLNDPSNRWLKTTSRRL